MHGEDKPPGGKLVAADAEVAGGRLAGGRAPLWPGHVASSG